MHSNRIALAPGVDIGGIESGERRRERLRHCCLRYPEQRGLRSIERDDEPRHRGSESIVGIDDIASCIEYRAQRPTYFLLGGVDRTVDFGHQRCLHRWARRYLDHLYGCGPESLALRGQCRSNGARNIMALAPSVLFVDQIDLQIALIAVAT